MDTQTRYHTLIFPYKTESRLKQESYMGRKFISSPKLEGSHYAHKYDN
jgi:hypothetical protein